MSHFFPDPQLHRCYYAGACRVTDLNDTNACTVRATAHALNT